MTTEQGKNKSELAWLSADAVSIHPMAVTAFNIAQNFNYQANTLSIPVNRFGMRSYDVPFAVEEKGTDGYLIFAGWEPIQPQFFNQQKVLPVWVMQGRISPNEIEQQAWAYLLKQISSTLAEDSYLVHTYQLAMACNCLCKITDIPERILKRPHLFVEHIHRVGRKRTKRQLKRWSAQFARRQES